jgi:hypothetical protein
LVSGDPVEHIVDAARRAPSGGNVQPWRFEAAEDEVRFFVLPERSSTMDVGLRGSYVAVGAALFNARVAAATLKTLGPVKLFPEGRPSHHVATLKLGSATDLGILPLNDHLRSRVANRRMGTPSPIDELTVQKLTQEVEREGAQLHFITDRDQIDCCATMLGDADRMRFLLPAVHREMLSELRWPGRDSLEEGLDVRTLEMDAGGYAAMELLSRPEVMGHLADWRAGQALGLRTRASVGSSSAVALITVPRPDPTWYVRGGAAMERFWLSAELHGLAIQPAVPVFLFAVDEADLLHLAGERHLEEVFQLSQQFDEFWNLGDGETAIMLLRVSHASPPSVHSVRLPLDHVFSREGGGASALPAPQQNRDMPHELAG